MILQLIVSTGLIKSRPHDRIMTAQSRTLWIMIIMTAMHIIKTAQADCTDGTIMLYAKNCLNMRNASQKNRSKFNDI